MVCKSCHFVLVRGNRGEGVGEGGGGEGGRRGGSGWTGIVVISYPRGSQLSGIMGLQLRAPPLSPLVAHIAAIFPGSWKSFRPLRAQNRLPVGRLYTCTKCKPASWNVTCQKTTLEKTHIGCTRALRLSA